VLLPRQQAKLARGAKDKEHAMSQTPSTAMAVTGIDIGKNSFHVVGQDARGARAMWIGSLSFRKDLCARQS
jgi:transposase